MRCTCCNHNLNDYESTLKSLTSGNFLDTCCSCLKDLGIEVVGNGEFLREEEVVDEEEDLFEEEFEEDKDV